MKYPCFMVLRVPYGRGLGQFICGVSSEWRVVVERVNLNQLLFAQFVKVSNVQNTTLFV